MTAVMPDLDALVYGADLRCETLTPPMLDRCPEPATWLLLLPCGCSVMYGDDCQPLVVAWLAALIAAGVDEMTCVQCRRPVDVAALLWESI